MKYHVLGICVLVVCASGRVYGQGQTASEELARRHYFSGQIFYERGDFAQAIADWQRVVRQWPESAYADDALIALARYYLDVQRDPTHALPYLQRVIEQYPDGDQAPFAYYQIGRIQAWYLGRGKDRFSEARANLERVATLYPHSPWAGPALIEAGRIAWLTGQSIQARGLCRRALHRFPGTHVRTPAVLCLIRAFAHDLRWLTALRLLADLQPYVQHPSEDRTLRDVATVLHRFVFRSSRQIITYRIDADFHLSRQIRWKKPMRLLQWSGGWAIADRGLKWVILYDPRGRYVRHVAFSGMDVVTIDSRDRVFVARDTTLMSSEGTPVRIEIQTDRRKRTVEPAGLAVDAQGVLWMYEKRSRALMGFRWYTARGAATRGFMHVATIPIEPRMRVRRLEIDAWQRLWLVHTHPPGVAVFARDGTRLGTLDTDTWHAESLDAVGLDTLGFVYVLDRKRRQVGIFRPSGELLRVLDLRALLPRLEPVDMLVMPDGSLYVLDARQRIVIHLQ